MTGRTGEATIGLLSRPFLTLQATLGVAALTLASACAALVDFPDVPPAGDASASDVASQVDAGSDAMSQTDATRREGGRHDAPAHDAGLPDAAKHDARVDATHHDARPHEGGNADGPFEAAADRAMPRDGQGRDGQGRDAQGRDAHGVDGPTTDAPSFPDAPGFPDAPPDVQVYDAGVPPSCKAGGPGTGKCGMAGQDCCNSLTVQGGSFDRTYTNTGTGPTGGADPATVSTFRLDEFLVTVARFRPYRAAWMGGWVPQNGSGKHSHVHNGDGLLNSATGTDNEAGWAQDIYDGNVLPSDSNLTTVCGGTWTPTPGPNDAKPIDCINWYEAYAFCIWDGGFLASESELEYASAGGISDLEYPWGSMDPGTANMFAIFNCNTPAGGHGCGAMAAGNIAPVGSAPMGAGEWGQLDLAGEVFEWTVDWFGPYSAISTDSAYLSFTYIADGGPGFPTNVVKGGAFNDVPAYLEPSFRDPNVTSASAVSRSTTIGVRCARLP